jgi:hypothetical protein
MNPRKGKKQIFIWLTEAEIESIQQSIDTVYSENISEIIETANERGDIIW